MLVLLAYQTQTAARTLVIVLIGVPVYLLWSRRSRQLNAQRQTNLWGALGAPCELLPLWQTRSNELDTTGASDREVGSSSRANEHAALVSGANGEHSLERTFRRGPAHGTRVGAIIGADFRTFRTGCTIRGPRLDCFPLCFLAWEAHCRLCYAEIFAGDDSRWRGCFNTYATPRSVNSSLDYRLEPHAGEYANGRQHVSSGWSNTTFIEVAHHLPQLKMPLWLAYGPLDRFDTPCGRKCFARQMARASDATLQPRPPPSLPGQSIDAI